VRFHFDRFFFCFTLLSLITTVEKVSLSRVTIVTSLVSPTQPLLVFLGGFSNVCGPLPPTPHRNPPFTSFCSRKWSFNALVFQFSLPLPLLFFLSRLSHFGFAVTIRGFVPRFFFWWCHSRPKCFLPLCVFLFLFPLTLALGKVTGARRVNLLLLAFLCCAFFMLPLDAGRASPLSRFFRYSVLSQVEQNPSISFLSRTLIPFSGFLRFLSRGDRRITLFPPLFDGRRT